MFVLVIGKNEFITITANHESGINLRMRNKAKMMVVNSGVMITVSKKVLLTHGQ